MVVPVGKLPVELLLKTFALAVSLGNGEVRPFGPGHPAYQSLLLSHVCSFWRQIVIGSPRLWAVGLVDVRFDAKKMRKDYPGFLQTLLDRSAPLPISISFTNPMESITQYTPSVEALVQVVAPTVARWKHLELDESSHGMWRDIDILRMPWGQLAHLTLEESVPTVCLSILLQCKNITSATLTTCGFDTSHVVDAPVTTLPLLKALKIHFEEGENVDVMHLFSTSLGLPALQTLDLAFDDNIVWATHEFSAFQMRAPGITRISLRFCPLTSQELVTLLRLAPSLTALKLWLCLNCINDELLRALTRSEETGAQRLVPQLEEIDWHFVGQNSHIGAFEAVIRSRGWIDNVAPPKLKRVTIGSNSFFDLIPDGWMQDLVGQGLELRISSS
ncbi:F-box domain-containing protein [Mycena venus]|uniref:F-box domain-containing protein n=1 Tax=Mycena venus TaxID=2733690 RepID=A0A8H7D3L7_9AGAR|nr:F-box domain-containing protein [Mycena venus]